MRCGSPIDGTISGNRQGRVQTTPCLADAQKAPTRDPATFDPPPHGVMDTQQRWPHLIETHPGRVITDRGVEPITKRPHEPMGIGQVH